MAPPAVVGELVERFDSHADAYRSGQYNEAQLREEFLNPFFDALGWDVYNKKGYAEAYKEVIHEAAIKVGGRTKAPSATAGLSSSAPRMNTLETKHCQTSWQWHPREHRGAAGPK